MCWRGGLSRFCAPVLQDCFLAALKLPGVSRWILPLVDICFSLFPFPSEQISLKRCFHRCFSFQIPVQNPFFFCFLKTKLLICKDNIVSIRTDIAFLLFSSYNDKHVNFS